MVREFYIENEKGQRFSLMDVENYCFLNSPSGLGYSYNSEYVQIENEFIQSVIKIAQGQIGGDLVFKNYENYKNFVNFVQSAIYLRFAYKVPYENSFKEFFKDIDISSVDKTEKRFKWLFNCSCDI